MDAIFGIAGDDFVVICADKTHCRSIVKMDVRNKDRRQLFRAFASSKHEASFLFQSERVGGGWGAGLRRVRRGAIATGVHRRGTRCPVTLRVERHIHAFCFVHLPSSVLPSPPSPLKQ